MSWADAPRTPSSNTRESVFETVSPVDTGDGVSVPVPERFIMTGVISKQGMYLPRYYYDPCVNAAPIFLTDPDRVGDYTPFKNDSRALATVTSTTEKITERYALQLPQSIGTALDLANTVVTWAYVADTPALLTHNTTVPDPFQTPYHTGNETKPLDSYPIFAVNNTFNPLPDDVTEAAGIIAREQIHTITHNGYEQHGVPLTKSTQVTIPDEFYWTVIPTTHPNRTLLTITPAENTEEPSPTHPVHTVIEQSTGTCDTRRAHSRVTFPLPRSISNLLDLPKPQGVVWISNQNQFTAVL